MSNKAKIHHIWKNLLKTAVHTIQLPAVLTIQCNQPIRLQQLLTYMLITVPNTMRNKLSNMHLAYNACCKLL